jgi:hypothetical protein
MSDFGIISVAAAHAPGADETLANQLSHQFLATHHFPGAVMVTALLIAGGALLLLAHRQNSRR